MLSSQHTSEADSLLLWWEADLRDVGGGVRARGRFQCEVGHRGRGQCETLGWFLNLGWGLAHAGALSCAPQLSTSVKMDGCLQSSLCNTAWTTVPGVSSSSIALVTVLGRGEMGGRGRGPCLRRKWGIIPAQLYPYPTAGCEELVNSWCSLMTLTAHLKQRGQVPPDGKEMGRDQGRRG